MGEYSQPPRQKCINAVELMSNLSEVHTDTLFLRCFMNSFNNWKLTAFILIITFTLSGCGDSPEDIYKKMNEAKSESEIQKLSEEFNKSAEVTNSNYESCGSSCSGAVTSISVSNLNVRSGKFPINGKVFQKNGNYQGSDMSLSNVKYDKKTKSLSCCKSECTLKQLYKSAIYSSGLG